MFICSRHLWQHLLIPMHTLYNIRSIRDYIFSKLVSSVKFMKISSLENFCLYGTLMNKSCIITILIDHLKYTYVLPDAGEIPFLKILDASLDY